MSTDSKSRDLNWIKHEGEVSPVAGDAIIHVITSLDRMPSFDVVAGGVRPEAWTSKGILFESGHVGKITHYVMAD